MRPECSHILSNGQKCHCLALRGRSTCRHHSTSPLPPPKPPRALYPRLSRWRELGRTASSMSVSEVPYNAYCILGALLGDGEDGISDRVAGTLLRTFVRRYGRIPFPPPPGTVVDDVDTDFDSESGFSLGPDPAPTAHFRQSSPAPGHPAGSNRALSPELLNQMLASLPRALRDPDGELESL